MDAGAGTGGAQSAAAEAPGWFVPRSAGRVPPFLSLATAPPAPEPPPLPERAAAFVVASEARWAQRQAAARVRLERAEAREAAAFGRPLSGAT
jgi:hypothetical protein